MRSMRFGGLFPVILVCYSLLKLEAALVPRDRLPGAAVAQSWTRNTYFPSNKCDCDRAFYTPRSMRSVRSMRWGFIFRIRGPLQKICRERQPDECMVGGLIR